MGTENEQMSDRDRTRMLGRRLAHLDHALASVLPTRCVPASMYSHLLAFLLSFLLALLLIDLLIVLS